MSIYNYIDKNIFLPVADYLMGTSISKKYNFLIQNQKKPLFFLINYQNKKLRELIKHAYTNVPYYRKKWKSISLDINKIKTIEDLNRIPLVTKQEITKNFNFFKSMDFQNRKSKLNKTGGSTGVPFQYYYDMNSWSMGWAANYRLYSYAGHHIGDKIVYFGGASLVPGKKQNIKKQIKNTFIDRITPISSFDITEEAMKKYVVLLNKIKKPFFFRGYASSLYLLAYTIESNSWKIPKNIKAIFSTAEKLHCFQRKKIESVFNKKVFDHYGCNDGGANAGECSEHNGLHITIERAIHGIQEKDNTISFTSGTGDIVLTDLWNYSFPLINYKPNDYATITSETCNCGRELPLFKEIKGRVQDFLITPEEKMIHGEFFSHIFAGINGVIEFQVIQDKKDHLFIKLNVEEKFNVKQLTNVISYIKKRSPNWNITFQFVDSITKTSGNKYRFVLNQIGK